MISRRVEDVYNLGVSGYSMMGDRGMIVSLITKKRLIIQYLKMSTSFIFKYLLFPIPLIRIQLKHGTHDAYSFL